MNKEKCKLVEKSTRTQSNSGIWYEMRYGRVTASKAHEAAQCHTYDGTLVEEIFGTKFVVETEAMKRGKVLENSVKKEVEKQKQFHPTLRTFS
ncbi:unnamed protein product [Parnassius apollo]|uniref:(apollo) hypothetical protein n=1 Tax=Parnassius apollo TaxID=110799 RepID=A0A8S3WL08_PARAO|nr:unnamed protein product [Parnassius apollo]